MHSLSGSFARYAGEVSPEKEKPGDVASVENFGILSDALLTLGMPADIVVVVDRS